MAGHDAWPMPVAPGGGKLAPSSTRSRPMRALMLSFALATGLALGAPAQAGGLHVNHEQCNFGTDYDVLVKPDGITFERQQGVPGRVFMHDGALSVDGQIGRAHV